MKENKRDIRKSNVSLTNNERYWYVCEYCGKEYVPKRRHKQKYCCSSCRVNAFKKKNKISRPKPLSAPNLTTKPKPDTNNKLSIAGIGNAAIANAAYDITKNLFTSEDNKPATKKDLRELLQNSGERFQHIKNIPRAPDGKWAFFDNQQQQLVYLTTKAKF